jgi:hypothetical protein
MDCHISTRVKGECDRCGEVPARLHMPLELHGWYCERCCPACNSVAKPVKPAVEHPEPVAA